MVKKVMMIGWHPSTVDYAKYPGLDAEKLEALLRKDEQELNSLGYDAHIGYIFSGETAIDQVTQALKKNSFDVVLIGAGVRKDDDHFLLFEQLINIVHEFAPSASIAFNTGPTDSGEAVQRWA